MEIDILTIFPSMFVGPFDTSIIKKAKEMGIVRINIHNLRDWANDKRKTVDDRPFGGGRGMVLMVEPIFNAVKQLKKGGHKEKVILLSPSGSVYNEQKALELSKLNHLILICGHYEGVDQRVADHIADEIISIGDYILTGGEIPAMVIIDSVVRLLPNVLEEEVITAESFSQHKIDSKIQSILDYPVYTRPADFRGWKVPEILLKGNHKEIKKWREKEALKITKKIRPDLLTQGFSTTKKTN